MGEAIGGHRRQGNEGRVLQAISEHDGLTSADIVRITGMPMGTVYQYVYNLREAGVIVPIDKTRRYKKYVLAGAG